MAALPVFRQIGAIADADFVAIDVLPVVWAFALGPLLDLKQFKNYMSLIKELSAKIESEQIQRLQEISSDSRNAESSNFDEIFSLPYETTPNALGDSNHGIDDDFANLVLGKPSSKIYSANIMGGNSGAANSFLSPMPHQPSTIKDFSSSATHMNNSQTQNTSKLGSSRSITPDYGMSKFAPLQPGMTSTSSTAISQSSMIQPLQPSNSSNSSSNNLNLPSNSSSFSLNKSDSNLQTPLTNGFSSVSSTSNLSNQDVQHNPFILNPSNIGNSSHFKSNLPAMSQSAKPYTSFSIPPPATVQKDSVMNHGNKLQGIGINTMNANDKQQQTQQREKQGLEKYESLL